MMKSNNSYVSVGYASNGELLDTVRMVWESAIKTTNTKLPSWALKIDLALKAHVVN